MKSLVFAAALATASCSAFAGIDQYMTTAEDGRKIVTIPANTTYTMTADDVTTIANADIVKLGEGTLVTAAEMTDYTGNIFISNGIWAVKAKTGLGTKDGQTYADGGTLENRVSCSTMDGKDSSFMGEIIHLKGSGYANKGALWSSAGTTDFCRTVILEGDTVVSAPYRVDFRFTNFTMNGYRLTTRGDFRLVAMTVYRMGDFVAEPKYFELQSSVTAKDGPSAGRSLLIKRGSGLGFWGSSTWHDYNLTFEDGTALSAGSGVFMENVDQDPRNVLNGPKVLEGALTNNISKNVQVQMRGYTTGPGGIVPGTTRGGWLQFADGNAGDSATNNFCGGVAVQGVASDGTFVGGLVVNRNGAIPSGANAGPVTIDNAQLQLRRSKTVDLPDLAVKNGGLVTNDGQLVTCNVKSLVKTGDGTLSVRGSLHVTGDVDFQGGTLLCASRVPEILPGLYWAGNTAGNNASDLKSESVIRAHQDFKGVDASGMTYAYNDWSGGKGFYHYLGYFKVPGEAGTTKLCRFSSCVFRTVKLWVDDTLRLQVNDSAVGFPSGAPGIGWSRHYWSDPVQLSAGWHRIALYMQGNYNSDNGPRGVSGGDATKYGAWPGSFGLGVDFNSTETLAKDAKDSSGAFVDPTVTDSSRFTKFTDPGDGSFLRATTNVIKTCTDGTLNLATYRPTFDGNVAFAGGTVLDLNDTLPYTVMTIPSLKGLPTIKSGAVNVTSTTWTIRPSDLDAGVPLTVESDATLTFGGAKTVTITGDAAAFDKLRKMSRGKPIFTAPNLADYTFTLSPALADIGYSIGREGSVLKLYRVRGLSVIIR